MLTQCGLTGINGSNLVMYLNFGVSTLSRPSIEFHTLYIPVDFAQIAILAYFSAC